MSGGQQPAMDGVLDMMWGAGRIQMRDMEEEQLQRFVVLYSMLGFISKKCLIFRFYYSSWQQWRKSGSEP